MNNYKMKLLINNLIFNYINMKILDRLVLQNILPNKTSFEDLIIRKDILQKVEITQEELNLIEFKTVENKLTWDGTKDPNKEIIFTESEKNLIKKSLKSISEKNELEENMMDLYKEFVK